MLSIAVSALIGITGLGLKLWLALRPSAVQQVAETDHAMLEDAANRPDPSSVADELRDGKFGR